MPKLIGMTYLARPPFRQHPSWHRG